MTQKKTPRRDAGFTKVAHYWIDRVMPHVSGAQWKVMCAVLRHTLGWSRQEAEMTYDLMMDMTGTKRQAVAMAVEHLLKLGALERRSKTVGKQLTFKYTAVQKANLKEVPKRSAKPPQSALPFNVTQFENQTPSQFENQTASEFENQTSTRFENQTPSTPVLRSIKEIKNKEINTHTTHEDSRAQEAASQRVCLSKFSKRQLREFAYASASYTNLVNEYWEGRGQKLKRVAGIRNPEGWATAARRSGEHDDDVQEWLDDPDMFNFDLFRQSANRSNF